MPCKSNSVYADRLNQPCGGHFRLSVRRIAARTLSGSGLVDSDRTEARPALSSRTCGRKSETKPADEPIQGHARMLPSHPRFQRRPPRNGTIDDREASSSGTNTWPSRQIQNRNRQVVTNQWAASAFDVHGRCPHHRVQLRSLRFLMRPCDRSPNAWSRRPCQKPDCGLGDFSSRVHRIRVHLNCPNRNISSDITQGIRRYRLKDRLRLSAANETFRWQRDGAASRAAEPV